MKLGIVPKYLRLYGLEAGAARLRAHGYDGIDYQGFVDTQTDFFNLPEDEFRARLEYERDVLAREGIVIHQSHGPWRYPPIDATPQDRAERFAAMSKAIRGCTYLGTDKLILHPLMPYGTKCAEHAEEQYKINFDFMRALCDVAAEHGVTLCFENMPFTMLPIRSAVHVTDFVRDVNHPNLKVCLDTGHCLRLGESLPEAVRYVGHDLLAALHVHDNDGTHDSHWLPYEGIGEWEAFVGALREIGYDGFFSLETSVTGFPEPEQETRERALADIGKRLIGRI